jgi:hypothetical protein
MAEGRRQKAGGRRRQKEEGRGQKGKEEGRGKKLLPCFSRSSLIHRAVAIRDATALF